MSDPTPAPGWYPAPHANNEQRYWDGTGWLEGTPTEALPADANATAASTPVPKKSKKKGWIIGGSIAAGVIVIASVAGALGGGKPTADKPADKPAAAAPAAEETAKVTVPDVTGMTAGEAIIALTTAGLDTATPIPDPTAKVLSTSPAAGTETDEGTVVTLTVEEKPKLSLGQQNAVDKAKQYLGLMGMSRTGLIDQLQFEGFSVEDSTFGADNAGADWNAECAEKAQQYLDMMAMSRDGLAEQLAFEGFQQSEIDFGLAAVGY